jgi:glycosyltransferase involved in cell wall biosynthesis
MIKIMPKISICLPVYNSESFLAKSLNSILSQTFHDFEVIISDNASTDKTHEIAMYYANMDTRIRYFRNMKNIGVYQNYNQCLEYITGDYIYFFGSDDIMLPQNLESKALVLDSNYTVGVVVSSVSIIDQNEKQLNWGNCHQYPRNELKSGKDWIIEDIGKRTTICHTSVMVRRTVLEKLDNFFDCNYLYASDFDLWLRIALISDIYFIKKILLNYRYKYQDYYGSHGRDSLLITKEFLQIWTEIINNLDISMEEKNELKTKALLRIGNWLTEMGLNITIQRNKITFKLMRIINYKLIKIIEKFLLTY